MDSEFKACGRPGCEERVWPPRIAYCSRPCWEEHRRQKSNELWTRRWEIVREFIDPGGENGPFFTATTAELAVALDCTTDYVPQILARLRGWGRAVPIRRQGGARLKTPEQCEEPCPVCGGEVVREGEYTWCQACAWEPG